MSLCHIVKICISRASYNLKNELQCPFLWMGFNYLKAAEPLRGGNLLFTTKSPEVSATHLINLERMKD